MMSRALVKEDDSGEAPIIPPRAALPPGTPNYVTPHGLDLLRSELQELEQLSFSGIKLSQKQFHSARRFP
jgi:hypothetical protein